jgi:8-oxo-dGTP diphosphatase
MSYTYQYPHPAVAADCVVFGFDGRELQVLLIERGLDPFKGAWAFPGGFMRMDESAEECAQRELREETTLNVQVLKQLGAFSAVHRDPRERVVSIAFYALVRPSDVTGGDDANQARWFALRDVPQLAFDHDFILRKAMQRLREDIYFEPVGFELLDREFTMSELQRLYEAILGVRFDRRNFEKKMLQTGILQLAEEDEADFMDRAAPLACEPAPTYSLSKPQQGKPAGKVFFGSKREMKTMSIDALFGSSDRLSEPQPKKVGRKGRKFSFNKEKYDHFKQNNNFRFEF